MTVDQSPEEPLKVQSLDSRIAKGVAWTAGAKWITQVFTWASLLVTARLLKREDYGIGEMAGLFFAITNTMAEFGVGGAVLHINEMSEDVIHQLHGFSFILCSGIYAFTVVCSPLIARFFHRPDLVPVIVVTNLTFFLTGLSAVPTGLLQRDMDYRRLSLAEGALYLVQAIVTVLAALAGWGYWALVLGVLLGKASNAIIIFAWKPIGFAWPKWKQIGQPLEFSRQSAFGNLATTALGHSDILATGRMLGDSALGTYRMAWSLASAPAEKLAMLVMRTAGPLFANVQSDLPLVRRYFMMLADILNLFIVPAMTGIVVLGPEAVKVILGDKWSAAVGPLSWLAVYMIISTMNSLITQILISQRLTKYTMRLSFLNLLVMPIAFFIGARLNGVTGVAAAWVISAPLTALPAAFILFRQIGLSWGDYLKGLFPILFSCAGMAASLIAVRRGLHLLHLSLYTTLFAEILIGASVYGLVMIVFFRGKIIPYWQFLQRLRRGGSPSLEETA